MRVVRFQWRPFQEQLIRQCGSAWDCLPFYFPALRVLVSVQAGPRYCSSVVFMGLDLTHSAWRNALGEQALMNDFPCEKAATFHVSSHASPFSWPGRC